MYWGLVVIVLLALDLVTGPVARPVPLTYCLAGGALLFELAAVPTAGFGFYSAASACTLSLLYLDGGPIAALAATLAIVARSLRVGRFRPFPEVAAAVTDLVPLLLCALLHNASLRLEGNPELLHLGRLLLGTAVYLGCHQLLLRRQGRQLPPGQYLPWLRLQKLAGEMRTLVALSALGMAHSGAQLWSVALLLPLWGTHQAVRYGIFRLHSADASRALADLDQLQATLLQVNQQSDLARRELQASREERQLLEEMTRYLTTRPDLESALDYILGVAERMGRFESLAILENSAEGLGPARYRGPLKNRVDHAGLLKLSEPLALAALQSGQPQLLRQDDPTRLFAGEKAAVAIPLGQFGVLYAGRSQNHLTEGECRGLLWMASRAAPLLEAIHSHWVQSRELSQTRQHSLALQGQVSVLSRLLHSSRQLASSLNQEELLRLAQQAVADLVSHEAGEIWLRSEGPAHSWGEACGPACAGVVAKVVEGSHPLLLPTLSTTPPRSALCVPLGEAPPGAILVVSHQADHFSREDQDGLCLLANQLGLALSNAAYLQKVLETQAQLIQSSKMTAVGQLAAGIAHELNSPLGAIALTLESVASLVDSPSAHKKLERAARSAERCRTIVEKLLVYTRLSSPVQSPVRLAGLVEDTLDFFHSQLELEHYTVTRELDPDVTVSGRSQELQQILVSLLLNAIESYPPDSLAKPILVTCGQVEGQAYLMVQDQGQGIAPDNLTRVFEPFYTTKTIGKNVGMGLSVSLEIARQHGGDLSIRSSPGQGTALRLTLPLTA